MWARKHPIADEVMFGEHADASEVEDLEGFNKKVKMVEEILRRKDE